MKTSSFLQPSNEETQKSRAPDPVTNSRFSNFMWAAI